MITFLISIIVVLCFLHIILNYNSRARLIKKIPGPKDVFIVGNGLDIILTPVETWKKDRRYAKKWNGIYRFWSYPFAAVAIYNPLDVEAPYDARKSNSTQEIGQDSVPILLSSMKHIEKSHIYTFLRPWLGDGLLLSTGSKWQHRRKVLTPAFHFNILKKYYVILEENSQRMVEKIKNMLDEPVDVTPLLSDFTLHSICETAMGTQLNNETSDSGRKYKAAIYDIGKLIIERLVRLYLHCEFIYSLTASKKKHDNFVNIIHNFTKKVVQDRKDYTNKYGNQLSGNDERTLTKTKNRTVMLDLLISAEKDGEIDSAGIHEEVDTFMFEGHDTTAAGLTFCLMLLANSKSIQDNIVAELKDIFGEDKRQPTMEDLSKMRYLERCIKESLRLYPPVHFISRVLSETVKFSGYTVPAGSLCNVQIYDLHRREELYKDPDVFDPDRFLPENNVNRHPFAYIPFSAGPRNCIGQKFAMMEMKSAVSSILREYELIPVTRPCDIVISTDLILRNDGPILVKFTRRLNK